MATVKFSVKAKNENNLKTVVEARGFRVIIDEPGNLGGTNEGPNPLEYLLAALSGCINITGHLVAKEMGFTLKGTEIALEGDINPAKFTKNIAGDRAGYKEIRVTIKPYADADKETLEKWLESVESRCPVSDNLSNATPIKVSLA
ncbi:MAG: OsmC family protein [Thermoanaerobacteraceae bacterium]|nr:OsmC family protein [Thermoanaerobacteraceae bacterium]